MDGALKFDGQKYISAKVAAQNFGYTSDYVGQLCRSKKVTSRLVGRSWYVLESDLVKHKETSHHQVVEANKNNSRQKLSKIKKIKTDSKKVIEKVEKDIKNEILNNEISAEIHKEKLNSYKPKENIANQPKTSRVAEIVEKKATYLSEENDLFPKPIKKFEPKFLNLEELKISLGIISGVEKPTKFEKVATRVLVLSLGVTFLLTSAFESGNLARLAHQNWWHNLKDEVSLVYGPYFQNSDLDLANQIQSNIAGGNNLNLNQLAAVLTGDSLRPALDWFKNAAYKIAKPWLNNDFAQNDGGDLLPPDSPKKVVTQVAVSEAPKTIVQSRTIVIPGSDRDYIDLRIDQKLTEFKKYFLTDPLAPNVNRYYVTKQNDVIVSRLPSSSSSSSGSSGVATFLELTDTQSSFTANRIIHTNGAGTALTDTAGFVFDGSNLGIGTTTPYAPLSVVGQIVGAYFTGTTTATSTFGGNLAINGTGTTTSNGGFNISAGCFALNGVCISGSGSGASSTLLADFNTWSNTNNFTGSIGISTSSPFARLSINSTAGENAFVIGSSTATSFIVDKNGRVGIGTASPFGFESGSNGISIDSNSTPSQISLRTAGGSGALAGGNIFGYKSGGTLTSPTNTPANTFMLLMAARGYSDSGWGSSSKGAVIIQSAENWTDTAQGTFITLETTNSGSTSRTERVRITDSGNLTIGTTTGNYRLTVASTTGAQLSLSAGAGIAQWITRNAGGNLYFATTTVAGTATTSISALEISGTGFGTTTVRGLNISGQATSTSNVGINLSAGCFAISGTCLSSGSGASSTLLADSNTWSNTNRFNGAVNLASVALNSIIATDGSGNVVATSTPTFGYFNATSTNATSTIAGGFAIETSGLVYDLSTNNVGINTAAPVEKLQILSGNILLSNQYRLRGLTTGGTNAGIIGIDGSDYTEIFSPLSGVKVKSANSVDLVTILNGGNVGIGTSTPVYRLTVASSTALSDGAGIAQWVQRNAGGNLYFATTTVAGTSTTTTSALSILGSNGRVGIGTTSPFARLSVESQAGEAAFVVGSSTATSLIVNSQGYVGVGTANPTSLLHVAGGGLFSTTSNNTYITVRTDVAGNGVAGLALVGGNVGNASFALRIQGNNSNELVFVSTDGNERARLSQTGNFSAGGIPNIGGSAISANGGLAVGSSYYTLAAPTNGAIIEGRTGISTTTPAWNLQVATTSANGGFRPQFTLTDMSGTTNQKHWNLSSLGGNFYLGTSTDLYATTSISALEISGSGFGTTTVRGLNISGQATTTSNVGINLSGGCFAISGTCISGGGSGASSTLLADSNTFSGTNNFTMNTGFGSSTPWGLLSVNPNGISGPAFVVGSSTETHFIVAKDGRVGVGTTSPYAKFAIVGRSPSVGVGEIGLVAIGGNGSTQAGADGIVVIGGDGNNGTYGGGGGTFTGGTGGAKINGIGGTGGSFTFTGGTGGASFTSGTAGTGGAITLTAGTGGAGFSGASNGNGGNVFVNGGVAGGSGAFAGNVLLATSVGSVGISTTTPYYNLTVASTTGSQLSLSSGAGVAQWAFRNAGGNFYLATTTVAGTATTSTSALEISGTGFGTTTVRGLNISGQATTTSNVGINLSGGCFAINGTCLSSGSGASSTLLADSNTFSGTNNFTGSIGISSSTPFARFSINNTAGEHAFVIGSSTATQFIVNSVGNVGVGTANPAVNFQMGNYTTAPELRIAGLDGANIGSTISMCEANSSFCYKLQTNTSANNLSISSPTFSNILTIRDNPGSVGVSTTTPYYNLTVASTTGAQLSLSAGADIAQWVQRNAGGNLYFATTTVAGTSTTTTSALTILGSSGLVGISTTSPFARLSVESQADEAAFVVGSSTATSLIVNSLGYVGIGTANPLATLNINGNVGIGIGSAPVDKFSVVGSHASDPSLFRIHNTNAGTNSAVSMMLGLSSSETSTSVGAKITAIRTNALTSGDSDLTLSVSAGSTMTERMRLTSSGAVGISTTTPYYNLTVASTTGPQLSLSAGAGIAQWVQRNAGGNLYFATTTVAGTATTTVAAFSILGTSGNIGIATTSPTAKLSLQATISTDDLFQVSSTTGASLFKINNYGALVQTLSSTTAISIQDSSGNAVFNVDTTQSTGAGLDITASGGQTANLFNIYGADGTTNYLAVGPSGNFGIGTGTPAHLFTVATSTTTKEPVFDIYYNSSGATSTVGFFVSTTTGSAAGVGLGLPSALANYMIVGNGKVQAGMAIVNGGLCIDNDGWCTASTTGRISSVTSTTGGSDVAEMYNSSEALEPGDVVAITEPRNFVKVANGAAGDIALGIVSTEPGVLLGLQPDANDTKGLVQDVETDGETAATTIIDVKTVNKFPIALAGRVPVKVSVENGEINPGDYLMLSSTTPGVAVKAVVAGQIVGQALEGYSNSAEGKILVFVKNTYYPGPAGVNIAVSNFDQTADLSETEGLGATILKFFDGLGIKVINGIAYMKNLFVERLTVGTAEKPSGITLYDEDTGDPYCLKIKNGGMVSIAGECVGMVEVIQPITDNDNSQATTTATTTSPTITDNNNSTTTATSTITNNNGGNQNSTTTAITTPETVTNNDNSQTTTTTPETVTNNSNNAETVTDNSSGDSKTTTTSNNP